MGQVSYYHTSTIIIVFKGTLDWPLTISDIKDVILNQTVPCNFLFSLVAGLPFAGKSTLIRNLLSAALFDFPGNSTSDTWLDQYNEQGLSNYSVSILQRNLTMTFYGLLKHRDHCVC